MKRKLFPTKLAEIRRLIWDWKTERLLNSSVGRSQYWTETGGHAARSPMIAVLKDSLSVPGDVIECGVYRGASLMIIAHTLHQHAVEKNLFALDSFQGFPEGAVQDLDIGQGRWKSRVRQKFRFCADTPTRLRRRFDIFGIKGEVILGYFANTLHRFRRHSFCFVHLDVDLHSSYLECLESLYDRVTPGGAIVFDECDSGVWPGSELAIREFFSSRPEEVKTLKHGDATAYYIRKLAPISENLIA